MNYGFGSVDVSQLAANFPRGGGFVPTFYDQFPGIDQGPTAFTQECLDDATSKAIAGMLPGSYVVKLPVESLQATNGPVPQCNWIQTPDGVIRASDVYAIAQQSCNIWGDSPECCLEQLLANTIPGGRMSSACGESSAPDPLITPGGPAFTPAPPVYVAPVPVVDPPIRVAPPLLTSNPVSTTPPSTSQVVSGTPGSNAAGSTAGTVLAPFSTLLQDLPALPTVGGFDLSTVPWWGWALAAGAVYMMLPGGRR